MFWCCLSFEWCCFVVACRWGVWCCVCLWCWGVGPKSSATGSPVSNSNPLPCEPHPRRSRSILHRWCIVLSPGCCRHSSAQRRSHKIRHSRCNARFARLLPAPVCPKTKTINGQTRARRVTCKQAQRTHTYIHTHTAPQNNTTPHHTAQQHNDTTHTDATMTQHVYSPNPGVSLDLVSKLLA